MRESQKAKRYRASASGASHAFILLSRGQSPDKLRTNETSRIESRMQGAPTPPRGLSCKLLPVDHEAGKDPSNEETRLAQIDDARHALDRARSIPEVRSVRDKSEAIRTYLKQQGLSLEAQNRAAELKVYAERRLGELLSRTVRRGGSPRSRRETSLPAGVNKTQSHRWQRLAAIPECEFDAHVAETKAKGKEVTSAGLHRLARELAALEKIDEVAAAAKLEKLLSAA